MSHVTVLKHQGLTVVHTHFPQGAGTAAMKAIIGETAAAYAQLPAGSILALVSFEGQEFAPEDIDLLEAVAKGNASLVKATAFLGVAGPQKALFNAMISITGRKAKIHDSEAAALGWLAERAEETDPLAGL